LAHRLAKSYKIIAAVATTIVLVLGTPVDAKDAKVERVQRSLVLSGYDPGPVDGYWGSRTASALAKMAKDMKLSLEPNSKASITSDVFKALDEAYRAHAEKQESYLPYLQEVMTPTDARHLLERSGIGAHPSKILELMGLTRSEAVTAIISGLDGSSTSTTPPTFLTTPNFPEYWIRWDYEEEERQQFRTARDQEMGELKTWWIREMITTPNPQAERLILLWHNHFVTAYSGVQEEVHAIARQHWTFRELGHTNFRDLTKALVRDAAMLNYLDNDRSRKEQPNENFARELMELFVLGEGNYTEQTVKEVARALTGYTYNKMRNFEFEFDPWDHDKGVKTVLGKSGHFNGDDIVNILLEQPAAAEFIASQFWNVYVSDFNKDPEEITRIANIFRESDFDIKVLLRTTLTSKAFWAFENRATIIKSPVDLMVGGIRSTGVLPDWWASLPNRLASIGQNLFEAPNVAGWPGGSDWMTPSRLLLRGEMIMDIAQAKPTHEDWDSTMNISEAITPVMSNGQTVSAPQSRIRKVFIRYAAEDFEGSPKFSLTAIGASGGNTQSKWQSPLLEAQGGIDTARFGRVKEADLPWRIATLEMPADVTYDSLWLRFWNDHCCGPGGSDGGDRNLFIDWVTLDGRLYRAEDGEQISTFGGCGNARPGSMYCSAKLVLTKFQLIEPDKPNSMKTVDLAQDATLTAERVAFQWAERLDLKDRWNSFNFAILNPKANGVAIDGVQVRIVRNRHENGWRTLLQLGNRNCFPSCFGGSMPSSANINDENGDRNVSFVLLGLEWPKERDQWNQLTNAQRAFVSALWMSVPDLLNEAQKGRNWRERDAESILKSWQSTFDAIERALPKSRYAKFAPKGGLKIAEPQNSSGMMMSMMVGLKNTSPQRIAGIDRDKAKWSAWRNDLQNHPPAKIFLAADPVAISPASLELKELMLDPVFNLK
jgi:uncharacterized protein (DUF1800 family)